MQNENLFDLQIDPMVSAHFSDSAKWARFIAIVGFVLCGIMALVALFMGVMFTDYFNAGMGVNESAVVMEGVKWGLVIGVSLTILLTFFPCLYLMRYANRMQQALRSNNQELLIRAAGSLKSCFKFIGIVSIVFIAFYAFTFLLQAVTS